MSDMTAMDRERARLAKVYAMRAARDAARTAAGPQPTRVVTRWPSGEIRTETFLPAADVQS
jgi:hypothetical protein